MRLIILFYFLLVSGGSFAQEPKEILRSIYFGGGSWYIDAEQKQSLEELIQSIPNLEYYEIKITSHTDNIGGREFNEYLSRMRSSSVIQQLIDFKVPQEIIRYKDFASDAPVFDNTTNEGRMRNRRVDILFTPIPF
ncbi:OmpA family protein [uncultured Arcticibacterium sp.]|uniref:OmpA family protein n=1 Tax=uncultured Arcticibacterium sp. TaxID=2173042 RepID=UPI0030F9B389